MKKLLGILLAVMLVLVAVTALADTDLTGKVVLLHTNDVHGRAVADDGVWGYAAIAQVKEDLTAAGAEVILIDDGDFSQGMPIVNLDYGASAIPFMNAAGYDLAGLGNHEFDWGVDNLQVNLELAEFPVICANLTRTSDGSLLFQDHVIFEKGGHKIGFFGLDTPETMTKTNPKNVQGVTFAQGEELYAIAQAQVDALKAEGCDIIVCLGHLGIADESIGNRSYDVIANTTGIDLFIDGHSHDEVNELVATANPDEKTLLVQTGCYFANIGCVVIDTDGTMTASLYAAPDCVLADMYAPSDDAVAAVVNTRNDEVNAQLGSAFATTEVDLNGERAPGVRTEETNLGDFAADAILWAANQNFSETVDAALTNGGGIRASIAAGDITMLDMKTVFPYGNTVCVLQVTGAELLEALEAATWSTPDAIGAFPQVSGIVYTIDTTVEYVKGDQYPDSTYFAPANPGSRVTITSVGGKDFDLNATYWIATNDFVAAGGDTYYAFKYAYAISGYNTTVALEDALVNYVTDVLGGVVGQQYAAPAGNITVITAQ